MTSSVFFQVNDQVQIKALVKRKDLNGKIGTISSEQDHITGRYPVLLNNPKHPFFVFACIAKITT